MGVTEGSVAWGMGVQVQPRIRAQVRRTQSCYNVIAWHHHASSSSSSSSYSWGGFSQGGEQGGSPEGTTIVSQATAVLISLSQFVRFTSWWIVAGASQSVKLKQFRNEIENRDFLYSLWHPFAHPTGLDGFLLYCENFAKLFFACLSSAADFGNFECIQQTVSA